MGALCRLLRKLEELVCDDEVQLVPRLGRITDQQGMGPTSDPEQYQQVLRKWRILMAFQMSDSQQADVTIDARDKKNNPAPLDGVPEWSTDNTDLLLLAPAADGKTCTIKALGPLGTGKVTVKADADLGSGSTEVIGVLDVEITGGQATVINVVPGTPTEQP